MKRITLVTLLCVSLTACVPVTGDDDLNRPRKSHKHSQSFSDPNPAPMPTNTDSDGNPVRPDAPLPTGKDGKPLW